MARRYTKVKKGREKADYARAIESIKLCMEESGMGVSELARALGTYRQKVHSWLNGTNTASMDDLCAMLRVFGKEMKW